MHCINILLSTGFTFEKRHLHPQKVFIQIHSAENVQSEAEWQEKHFVMLVTKIQPANDPTIQNQEQTND